VFYPNVYRTTFGHLLYHYQTTIKHLLYHFQPLSTTFNHYWTTLNIYRTTIERLSFHYRTFIEPLSNHFRTSIEHLTTTSNVYRITIECLSNHFRTAVEHLLDHLQRFSNHIKYFFTEMFHILRVWSVTDEFDWGVYLHAIQQSLSLHTNLCLCPVICKCIMLHIIRKIICIKYN